jgi:TPP-dependent pyruvate/acetoin dehydrogenase alpha subunit
MEKGKRPMTPEFKKRLYYDMLRIRMVEEAIAGRYPEQEMRCPVHLSIGQEAVAVGVCAHLTKTDYVMSTHRAHAHYLAKGGDLRAMLAEIYGKATGCSRGKGGSQHIVDLDAGFMGSTPIVGGIIPITVGTALGTAMKGETRISVCFIGDAATEEGVFTESLNFASLKKLPVIFVSENNFFSVYSPLSVRQPAQRNNIAIAEAYGIYADKGNGNDVLEIFERSAKALEYLRRGLGPAYLEFDTYRWREHCGPNFDNDLGYRTEDEYLKWRKRCPIEYLERVLKSEGVLSDNEVDETIKRITSEIEEAFHFAISSPSPVGNELYRHLYAN